MLTVLLCLQVAILKSLRHVNIVQVSTQGLSAQITGCLAAWLSGLQPAQTHSAQPPAWNQDEACMHCH